MTVVGLEPSVPCPEDRREFTDVCFSLDIEVEKDGFWPVVYTPYLFTVEHCFPLPGQSNQDTPVRVEGTQFKHFFRDGFARSTVYFERHASAMCDLRYFASTVFQFR
jgi:hypothetical protein